MNKDEIKTKAIEICNNVFQNFNIPSHLIEYIDFTSEIGMDSITFISLIVEIESHFQITISDEFLFIDHFSNIESIVQCIMVHLTTNTHEKGIKNE